MQSKYLHYYQFFAWISVYTVIVGTIYFWRGLGQHEIYFATSLIGSAALYSYFIRYVFTRFIANHSIFLQISYFLAQSFIGAGFASLMLAATILLFSFFGLIPVIPNDSISFMVNSIFWGNWFNMLSALVFWSSAYLLFIKVRQLYAAREALASSRLDALSQQLNPHFLFNTLNNIRASILEEPQKARDALAQLADMLRYTLEHHKDSKIALGKELVVVEEFIALCKIQYEDRLNFQANIQAGSEDALIPRMLLQLCAENAIKHGISQLKQGGLVSLNVWKENQKSLHIEMTNPVDSYTNERNDNIDNSKLNPGIGLKNIKQRLAILYSKSKELTPSLQFSINDKIAKVVVVLPYEHCSSELLSSKKGSGENMQKTALR
jgi:sensor histidine kinase YesM